MHLLMRKCILFYFSFNLKSKFILTKWSFILGLTKCYTKNLISSCDSELEHNYGKHYKFMLWDSVPSAYPCLDSYHQHGRGHTSKGDPCCANQVCVRLLFAFSCVLSHCVLIPIIMVIVNRVLFWSFLAIACPPGHWIVEEVMSLRAWTQWKLNYSPSPPQSPLLIFLSTQDHRKPGASSHSETSCWINYFIYELLDCS